MNKLKYLAYCLGHMNYGAALHAIRATAKESGKPGVWILGDMVWCGLRYQAGYNDYRSLDFYLLDGDQRASVLTRGKNNVIVRKYNDKAACIRLDDKGLFCKLYDPFLHREWLDLREASEEDFKSFAARHPTFIVKPVTGIGGAGVEKKTVTSETDLTRLYTSLREGDQALAEELVIQHPELAALYPQAVNSLRLYTFYDGKDVNVLRCVLKLGNHGSVVDNDASGGMFTFLEENGVVKYPAVDLEEHIYDKHPETGKTIPGFRVPFFREALALVKEAALVTPQVAYVGWDVAITTTGPALIEGNSYPGVYDPKGRFWNGVEGCLSEYKKYMDLS